MATRKVTPPPPAPPVLRVSPEEANARIQAQIDEGERLLTANPRSEDELERLKEERRIWSDYNRTLLGSLFTTSAIADEYGAFYGGAYSMRPSFAQLVDYYHDSVKTSITRLRSILRRLELYRPTDHKEIPPANPTTVARGSGVFLVHGHNNEAKETVARFLERLGLGVTVLHEQPDKGRTIIEKFVDHSDVGYAVVLLTADDVGSQKSATELAPRARQNVVLELGYFLGRLGRTHVCALREDGVEVPSDLSGVLYLALDAPGAWRLKLASEIKAAGIPVDMNRAV